MICKADVCLQTIIIYISVFCKQLMVRRYIVSNIVNTQSKFYLAYICILIILFYEYKLLLENRGSII
jgi:hypothetical protein